MDVAKQNYIKACVDLSEEKEMILVDMESKEENLKNEKLEEEKKLVKCASCVEPPQPCG